MNLGNQIVNMMINKIKHNNPKMSRYIDEIQSGGNTSEILQKAITMETSLDNNGCK